MPTDCIPFRETGYFSQLICDYVEEHEGLKELYNRFPKIENFEAQIAEKKANFPQEYRKVLVSSLNTQYVDFELSSQTKANIDSLAKENTFTVVTGHQLNLFTGPLYFLYKIIATINLAKELKTKYPSSNFVPIYWMATEDHDFDEINFFNFKGKKVQWNKDASGAVGKLETKGLQEVFDVFSKELGVGRNADRLKSLFEASYLKHDNLTDATRFLANELFADQGLVIVDGDDIALKQLFVPHVKKELIAHEAYQKVTATVAKMTAVNSKYKVQVNPREINLFYLDKNLRSRIIKDDKGYYINDTEIRFSQEELLSLLDKHPERFSPNVIMRPLYQETILPNLCYIGGGGEIAYWLQLKAYFEESKVTFPMVLVRNSALIMTELQKSKLKKLDITNKDLFLKKSTFINKKVREISNINIDFSQQKELLQEQFSTMYTIANETDKSFLGTVKAQEVKQLKGLATLEKRLLKAQRKKLADQITRMTDLQTQLFPNESLQERNTNFSEFYLAYGNELISYLLDNLKPLNTDFLILTN